MAQVDWQRFLPGTPARLLTDRFQPGFVEIYGSLAGRSENPQYPYRFRVESLVHAEEPVLFPIGDVFEVAGEELFQPTAPAPKFV